MAEQSPLALDDVIDFPWHGASNPDLSADGGRVVYTCDGAVWCVETAGGEPQRLTEGARPRYSPVGDEIAFLRGQPSQVWVRDADGKERPVTDLTTGVTSFAWSPDGRRLATISSPEQATQTDPDEPTETIIEVHRRPPLPPGHVLHVTDRLTEETRLVATAAPGVIWSDPVWSPAGDRLALVEDATDATIRSAPHAEESLHLAVVELATGSVRYPAGRSRRKTYIPAWSPDGTRLAFPYSPHDFIFPWHWDLGVVSAPGGDVRCISTGYFIQDSICWHLDNRTVYCQGARGSTHQVLQVDTDTGQVQPLTDAPGGHEEFCLSKDDRWLICTYTSPTSPKEVYLLSTDGHERRRLSRTRERLQRFHLAEAEIVQWRASDGLELEGVLVRPLEYQPGQPYPMIVDLHGGPVVGGMAWGFYPEWHWLAAQGYMVFAPDFRGGQTYGWWPPPAEAEPGYEEYDFHDVMAGVDWLVEMGYADPERLGVHGISYGSCLIRHMISRTHRFQAAVAVAAGVASLDMHYGAFLGGNPILARELGGRPWEVPEVYERHNPMPHLHNARTPTLILKGEHDRGVGPNVLYTWLYQLGVEVEYVVYRGEGHTISKPEHRKDYWRRALAWFDRHLGR